MKVVAIPGVALSGIIVAGLIWLYWPTDLDRAMSKIDDGEYAEALSQLNPLVESGDAKALFVLGNMHALGQGVAKDNAMAIRLYRDSAQKRHNPAANALGDFYFGNGKNELAPDLTQAVRWYLTAAANGDPYAYDRVYRIASKGHAGAQFGLGELYDGGIGVPVYPAEAARWYRRAAGGGLTAAVGKLEQLATRGSEEAAYHLGRIYALGESVAVDHDRAISWYRTAAAKAEPEAEFQLGVAHEKGLGVARDSRIAVEWYRKAAQRGNEAAQFQLGLAYKLGRGVEPDDHKAIKWFRKTLEQGTKAAIVHQTAYALAGFASAQQNLGQLFFEGRMAKHDYQAAVAWWRMAAVQGHLRAQTDLAYMFAHGYGVPMNGDKAAEWYAKATAAGSNMATAQLSLLASKGNATAQYLYGVHLVMGGALAGENSEETYDLINAVTAWVSSKIKAPLQEGLKWLNTAAEQGHAPAQFELGKLYRTGQGVTLDKDESQRWFRKAAAGGHGGAAGYIDNAPRVESKN